MPTHEPKPDKTSDEMRLEQELDDLLRQRLPRYDAPAALRADLTARYLEPRVPNASRRNLYILLAATLSALLVLVIVLYPRVHNTESSPLVAEALNDHLRILYSEHPVEIASGGIHQVKPWFEGKVDFAPVEPFAGDADFPLEGGSVAYYIDRKAAAFVFKRRLHVISLFVFRADGLTFPAGADVKPADTRGFHVLVWRRADLGYALVSDVDPADLLTLATKIRGGG